MADAIALIDYRAELSVRRKTVFQIAAYRPRVDRKANGLAHLVRRVAITAFEIDRDRKVGGADDPAQIVDHQGERNALAIGKAVCVGDRPATRRDRLGTALGDGPGPACIPDVEEDERLSGDMQRPEFLGLVLDDVARQR